MKWSDDFLNPAPRVLRQFAAAWLVLFLVMSLAQALPRHRPASAIALGGIALIGLAGLLKPAAVRWLFVGSTLATFPVGWGVTQITLAFLFYFVLTPVAMGMRWRGRDELRKRRGAARSSFWIAREGPEDPGRYLKPF